MLQDILKVVLYKGNTGHQEILRGEGKCNQFDPVPLVLVKDIMNYMPQMKYMFNNIAATSGTEQPTSKRARVSWPKEETNKSSINKSIFHSYSSPTTALSSSHNFRNQSSSNVTELSNSLCTSTNSNSNTSLCEPSGFGLGNLWF